MFVIFADLFINDNKLAKQEHSDSLILFSFEFLNHETRKDIIYHICYQLLINIFIMVKLNINNFDAIYIIFSIILLLLT